MNNFEEPFKDSTQEPNTNNIPEYYQNNCQNQANISTPYQNNTQIPNNLPEPYQNNLPEPYQNNFPEPYQNNNQGPNNLPQPYQNNFPEPYQNNTQGPNNLPQPYQNNFPEPYQNNNQGFSQNNNPGPIQNNNVQNNLNQGIRNPKLSTKMKSVKAIFLIILIIIFISEIVVDFFALSPFCEPEPHDDPEASYFGEGLVVLVFLFFFYPILIILSSTILCLSCWENAPIIKIVVSVIICCIRGFIISRFINDYNKKTVTFTIILEILNFVFMITSITYQIIIKTNLNLPS